MSWSSRFRAGGWVVPMPDAGDSCSDIIESTVVSDAPRSRRDSSSESGALLANMFFR